MSIRLQNAIMRLPPAAVEEVADFAEYLAEKQHESSSPAMHLRLDWFAAAADLKNQYSSGVEAAHAAQTLMARRALGEPKT